MKPTITFILTGGTIDKEYGTLDKAFTVGNGAVGRILSYVKPNFKTKIVSVAQKVSVNINEIDKEKIKKACLKALGDKVIVTYGTDAMTELGDILKDINGKTVVITGALKSQLIKETDAEFNIGFATAAVQTLPYGVYIAMSGRVYLWNQCKKNTKTGQFLEIKNK